MIIKTRVWQGTRILSPGLSLPRCLATCALVSFMKLLHTCSSCPGQGKLQQQLCNVCAQEHRLNTAWDAWACALQICCNCKECKGVGWESGWKNGPPHQQLLWHFPWVARDGKRGSASWGSLLKASDQRWNVIFYVLKKWVYHSVMFFFSSSLSWFVVVLFRTGVLDIKNKVHISQKGGS